MEQKKINIALLGLGNIGQGVAKIIHSKKEKIKKISGIELNIKKALVKDTKKVRHDTCKDIRLVKDPGEIFEDEEIDVIIELIGGVEEPRKLVHQAIKHGKHVVTANKALIAEHGDEIFAYAVKNNVRVNFEASVAGCIPIIKSLKESLVANDILEIMGILNGTTNFILTKMQKEGLSYEAALKLAQELGFAEPNPFMDVSGTDAAQKLLILSRLAFNVNMDFDKILVEGIKNLSITDIDYAKDLGYTLKLLAICKRHDNKLELRVHPTLVPDNHMLAKVNNELNAVFLKGDFIGEQVFYGRGAGALPTASVVVSDIIDIFKKDTMHKEKILSSEFHDILDKNKIYCRFYIRALVEDKPGVLAKMATVLADNNISILSVIQKEERTKKNHVHLIFMTHEVNEEQINRSLENMQKFDFIKQKPVIFRVEASE